ncbi:MAG TPA: ABC transporter substrate-binding protein [Solirubrobacteraceae bacterium]|nr:ABC transporter substrate-binding protein [Solirubrobacteraceae bacterium]
MRQLVSLAILLAAVLALAGCGSDDSGAAPNAEATLLLDFQPNAVHTGIYSALQGGYDSALGVNLRVRVPGSSTDAVKLLVSGRADLAVLDIHDLAIAREAGRDLVGVMALVQTPLAAILARPGIRTPRELEGRRVGVTGLPSDDAVLRSIVAGAGGDPAKVRATTIGFTAVRSVLTGRVAAATGFWNAEGVALRERRPQMREFRVDDYGAPAYPELVLTVTRETLQDRASTVRAAVAALARGYEEVLADPENGVSALVGAVNNLDRAQVERELDAVLPSFTAGARAFGELDRSRLEAWARWEKRFGITKREPEVGRAFDGRYVPAPGRD